MAKKSGLGKGAAALFSDIADNLEETSSVVMLNIIDVQPNANQPRRNFDDEKLDALADSIKANGIIQPIIVVKHDDMYMIVAGERRWRAARKAGLKEIPAIVQDYSDKQIMEVALIENLQREDLNPVDEAMGYKTLMNMFSLTQEQISERIGKSRSAVANSLRLLNLSEEVLDLIKEGKLTEGHAKVIMSLKDPSEQLAAANAVINKRLSVRETEQLVKAKLNPPRTIIKPNRQLAEYLSDLEDNISKTMGTRVKIHHKNGNGKIEIDYYSNDEFERIMEYFKKQ